MGREEVGRTLIQDTFEVTVISITRGEIGHRFMSYLISCNRIWHQNNRISTTSSLLISLPKLLPPLSMALESTTDGYGYDTAEISPGAWRFLSKHAQIFRRSYMSIGLLGWCSQTQTVRRAPVIEIFKFLYNWKGREPVKENAQKILKWPTPPFS